MYKNQVIAILFVAVLLFLVACARAPQQPERIIVTVVIKITATQRPPELPKPPEPTTWVGVIHCPECDGLALRLWQKIDDIGFSPGKVYHGDTCVVIDTGVTDGIKNINSTAWANMAGLEPWVSFLSNRSLLSKRQNQQMPERALRLIYP